jgi:hypothetical protein
LLAGPGLSRDYDVKDLVLVHVVPSLLGGSIQ